MEPRFGVLVLPDAPFPTLFARWSLVEELGFDFVFAPDHARHTSDPSAPWFHGLTVVAAMALQTRKIRIGTLVANPILHLPGALAKAAAAMDNLSGGRLELGLGMGVEEFDHQEAGSEYWSVRERAARYSEYVEVVDGVLQSSTHPFSFEGRYYRTTNATLAPSSLQRPRLPIIIGSRSATGRVLAVERGDCWNTYALSRDGSVDEIAEQTLRRNNELDERCAEINREPRTLRRSLVMWPPLDPWADADAFQRIVETFVPTGVN
ncbi:MAG TPA: LLM class flavin-dependent oxidoreductase, partial [Solirubrobacteraceae bacterium]|nr:LLM class flavin-dependent oxidoreductase [Solirubrobacteraceae bacterium]